MPKKKQNFYQKERYISQDDFFRHSQSQKSNFHKIITGEATTTKLGKAILMAILSCGLYRAPIVTLATTLALAITYGAYALWVFGNKASTKIDRLAKLPFAQKKTAIRQLLKETGTDVEKNDNDPIGDGDQTTISTVEQRDVARHLWATGGDILEHFTAMQMSPLAMACASGNLTLAKKEMQRVKSTTTMPLVDSAEFRSLLETRETSMRLPPLLLIVSFGKHIVTKEYNFECIAKLLLKNGASPIAKDVAGKTVAHYGAGGMATKMTLNVTDMCVRATQSHHLFGKKVKLHGLKTESMNGKEGIVGGFDPDSDRRGIYLTEEKREMWVKVDNIMLLDASKECQPYPLLTDIQDRLGSVSLHELTIPSKCYGDNVAEAAEFLLGKWKSSIYTQDCDGCSPISMASGMGQLYGERNVVKLIMEAAAKKGTETSKARKRCANCNKDCVDDGKQKMVCSRCNVVRYCGRDCQVKHWKVHKKECAEISNLSAGVKLGPPQEFDTGRYTARISNQTGGKIHGRNMKAVKAGAGYKKPRGTKFNEKFVIKCQGNSDMTPILIYDETRSCNFHLWPSQKGFKEILETIRNEPAWLGRKTFMKASFDQSGICTVYTERAGVKSHYSW